MNSLSGNKPDFIIIGAMKCATSTLHDQLGKHESIFMTTPKEPYFFSDDEVYAKGIDWYGKLFASAKAGQLKGESSTHYTKLPNYPETVRRMAGYCPAVKCIYIMRHPVDRLVSHYIHEWTQGIISCDIEKAVKQHHELVEYGRYNMQMEPYLEKFGASAILPLFAERLQENPIRELQTVFDFLGVDEKPVWHQEIRSNVSSERLRVCTWRDAVVNTKFVTVLRRTFIPKSFRRRVRSLWTLKERPVLSPEAMQHVVGIFDRDLELLGKRLGVTLNCSNFKKVVLSESGINWVHQEV